MTRPDARSLLTDTGLAAHLLSVSESDLRRVGHPALGGLVETFVHSELVKLATVSEIPVSIWQFRENDDREIDFILEGPPAWCSTSGSGQARSAIASKPSPFPLSGATLRLDRTADGLSPCERASASWRLRPSDSRAACGWARIRA
jgi:hypothetical protein